MEEQELWYFLFGGGSEKVTSCIFGLDFLSPHTTKVLDIENYPNTMSCCSDDLAQLLPYLDL